MSTGVARGLPIVSLGSTVIWQINAANGADSVTVGFNPDLEDVTDSIPTGLLDGHALTWTHVDPSRTSALQLVTRIRGQAGCNAIVPVVVVSGATTVQASVGVLCSAGVSLRADSPVVAAPIVTATLRPDTSNAVNGALQVRGSDGSIVTQTLSLTVPVGALTETTTLQIASVSGAQGVTLLSRQAHALRVGIATGSSFQIQLIAIDGVPVQSFNQPVTLCLSYAGFLLNGLLPQNLQMAYQDPATGTLVALPSTIDPTAQVICARILHPATFQVSAQLSAPQGTKVLADTMAIAAERLVSGGTALARQQALIVARELQQIVAIHDLAQSTLFAVPFTALMGRPEVIGVMSIVSSQTITYSVQYDHGPLQTFTGTTNQNGYQLTRIVVPSLHVTPTSHDQRLGATVHATIVHLNGTIETRTAHFTVLVPRSSG